MTGRREEGEGESSTRGSAKISFCPPGTTKHEAELTMRVSGQERTERPEHRHSSRGETFTVPEFGES